MIETNIKNLSVEEIMQKIKQEVEKRKQINNTSARECQMVATHQHTNCDIEFSYLNVVDNTIEPFVQKEQYEYADFSKYHDVEFIKNCYRGLLKREADNAGLHHYLNLLRSGEKSKSEIISILHYSKEGKNKNIKLLGSKKRYMITILNSLPLFGSIFKWSISLATLPRVIKRLNQYENFSYQLYMKNIDNEVKLQNMLNKNIQDSITSLNAFMNTKTDKTEVEQLANELQSSINTKTDKTEVEQLANELQSSIDTKTDKTEVEQLANELHLEIKDKVHENTLIHAQNDIEKKLSLKIDVIKEIPNFLEVKADNFLADAIVKFPYTPTEFDKFNNDELYYSLFEQIFYNHEVVKEKQKVYLDYIPSHNSAKYPHLDIGCGRGEFLYNLKTNNHKSIGIDINSLEIVTLLNDGFDVKHIDMQTYLKSDTAVFSSISALQVIEHLEYKELKILLELSFKKLKKNGVLILETINPHNEVAFNSFYMDETHKRPLPPEMVAFLMQWYGFKNIKFVFTSPMPEEYRSKDNRRNYHDYAVIGYKI